MTTPLTAEELDALTQRYSNPKQTNAVNFALGISARTDIPKLLDEVERLRELVKQAERTLHECTKEAPYKKGMLGRWIHDAHEVGEQHNGYPGGDIVTMECKVCGKQWERELPQ